MPGVQLVEVVRHLSHIPLFETLAPKELGRMAKGTREVRMAKGRVLFRKGDAPKGFYVLIDGQIKLALSSTQGIEKVVEIIQPGQSFGEATMFSEKPYVVFAEALNQSIVLHVSKAAIDEELQDNHEFAKKLLAGMAMRSYDRMTYVEANSLQSGTQRFISFITTKLSDSQDGDESAALELPAPKRVIASCLNLTPEHFSRILHDLGRLGLIVVEGRRISIPSVPKLKNHHLE